MKMSLRLLLSRLGVHSAISCILCGGYFVARLVGAVPFAYEGVRRATASRATSATRRARTSRWWLVYCGALLFLTVATFPAVMQATRQHMPLLVSSQVMLAIGYSRYLVLQAAAALACFHQIYRSSEIAALTNEMLRCLEQLRGQLKISGCTNWRAVRPVALLVGAKLLTFSLTLSWTWYQLRAGRSLSLTCLVIFFYYCKLLLQMTFNMFFVGSLLLTYLADRHNAMLRHALGKLKCVLGENRRRWPILSMVNRSFKLELLSAELLQLLQLHSKLVKQSQQLLSFYSLQVLAYLLSILSECIFQLFMTYFIAYSKYPDSIRTIFRLRFKFNAFAFTALLSQLLDTALFVCCVDTLKAKLHEPREVFYAQWLWVREKKRNLRHSNLTYTMNLYSWYLCQMRVSFKLCGLFKLDRCLALGIANALLMYSLLLIQFDKIMYD